jgi:hypothetical protein
MRPIVTTTVLLVLAVSGLRAQVPADLVVYGRVWTGDTARPWADAVAVRGERIVAVGTRAEVRRLVGPRTRVLDNGSALVTPGLADAHTHFVAGGVQLVSVDLRDAASPGEFLRRIAAFARTLPAGQWVTGGRWDHERWPGSPLPRREWLDSVIPNTPVFVNRLDGHMGVANSLALRLAHISRDTPDPPGGLIVRDSVTGEPTGVLKDNAQGLMGAAIPPLTAQQDDSALERAMHYAASLGVTQVHSMGTWEDFATFRRARARGTMITRVRAYVPMPTWRQLADTVLAVGRGDAWLSWGGLKGYMDGSLGSMTAAFYEPYRNATTRGLLVTDSARRRQEVLGADSVGLQIATHAIGDRANAMILGFYEEAAREHGPRDRRARVEHAQHLRQQDIPRFGSLGVIASVQPSHLTDDGRWAASRLDTARLLGTYPFRTLLDTGARLAFGSDWSVATLDPIQGIYAAVTRRTSDDKNPGGWFPAQKIALDEALRAYTAGVAYAGFLEDRLGVLRPGMLADITLIDRDLFAIPAEQIALAHAKATIVGGRVVYSRR